MVDFLTILFNNLDGHLDVITIANVIVSIAYIHDIHHYQGLLSNDLNDPGCN